jgi:hypothetical protein
MGRIFREIGGNMKVEGPCEIKIRVDGNIFIEINTTEPNKKYDKKYNFEAESELSASDKKYREECEAELAEIEREDPEPKTPEFFTSEKGKLIFRTKSIAIWENILKEIEDNPLLKRNIEEVLKKWYPKAAKSNATIRHYAGEYARYLRDKKGLTVIPEKRKYKPRHKTTTGTKLKYGIIVYPWMEEKVKSALPGTTETIIKKTGMKKHQVLASLKVLVSKEGIFKVRDGVSITYRNLTTTPSPVQVSLVQPEPIEPENLVNEHTKKIQEDYDIEFKTEAVKELSRYLNNSYMEILKTATLKKSFQHILEKYKQTSSWKPYLDYFEETKQLEDAGWGKYRIVKDLCIPKKKEEQGILNQLFPEEMKNDESKEKAQ